MSLRERWALPSVANARLDRPDQQPARTGHAADVELLREDGHDVRVTARDFAQTVELCERLGIAHTTIGHHRGGRLAAKAVGSLALGRPRALGPRRPASPAGRRSTSPSATARTTSRRCALLRIPSSTMFDYEWATVQHNVNCRLARAVVVPDAIPPERLYATARGASCAPTRA
jgi:predicted glycosyltransferase